MKKWLLVATLITACGTDDAAPTNSSNNSTSGHTTATSSSQNNNDSNHQTNQNNNTSGSSNNHTHAMTTADMGSDMADVDAGTDTEVDTAHEPPLASGETCAEAIVVAAGDSIPGTTVGAVDDYEADFSGDNCPNNSVSGPDRVYAFTSAVTGQFKVTVIPDDDFDAALYMRTDCALDACVDGTILNGPGVSESLTFTAEASITYYIIVDGELGDSGSYTLTLESK